MIEDRSRKYFLSIIFILLIIILILLFFTKLGKINNYLIPTGNVDVFDIDIDCNCTDEGDIPVFDESTDTDELGKIFINDQNGNYIYQQKLDIFNNSAFEYTNKIAPGVSNTYHFVVHNSNNKNLKYNIEIFERTEYKINLKYRLRKNNEYIIGDDNKWVGASELTTSFNKINSSSSDSYSLDWKWFDSDHNDTIAGKYMTSEYKINIRFYFEVIES